MDTRILNGVKEYKEFLTVNELQEELKRFGDKANIKLITIGKSANGVPIRCAILGEGKQNALVFGFPHPNEPVGSLTCLELIRLVSRRPDLRKRFKWYIVPCADPDGAKLNEGWFKRKFTIKRYAHNFYRSKAPLQTDWSFPVNYKGYKFSKSPQNVKALAKLIRKIKPSLVYPVHNAGFGGAYFFYRGKFSQEFYDKIVGLCNDLEILPDMGEPEAEFIEEYKKPVFKEFHFEDYYEYYKKAGLNPKTILDHGTNSVGFAKKYNPKVVGLIGEIPYIYDDKLADTSQTDRTLKEIRSEMLKESKELIELLGSVLKLEGLNKRSIFYDTRKYKLQQLKNGLAAAEMNLNNEKYQRMATVAEEFNDIIVLKFYDVLALGETRRLLLESKQTPEMKEMLSKIERKLDDLIGFIDKNSNHRTFPIKKLVRLQLGCLLITLEHINR